MHECFKEHQVYNVFAAYDVFCYFLHSEICWSTLQVFYFCWCSKFMCHKYKQMYSWLIEYANYAQSLLLHNYFFVTTVRINTFLLPGIFNAERKKQCRWSAVLFIYSFSCLYLFVHVSLCILQACGSIGG